MLPACHSRPALPAQCPFVQGRLRQGRPCPRPIAMLVVALLAIPVPIGAETHGTRLAVNDLFGTDPHGRTPDDLAWRPGSSELLYTWDDGSGEAIWLHQAESGEARRVGSVDAMSQRAGGRIEILGFDPTGRQILLGARGDLFTYTLGDGDLVRLTESPGKEEGAAFSKSGHLLAFSRDSELHVLDLESREERQLSFDGEPDVVFNGITDWVYWEEIWGRESTGFWWSDDGCKIAYYHIDDSDVAIYPLVDTNPVHPVIDHQRYPKSGDPLPKVEIRVVDLTSGETLRLDTHPEDEETYLARVHWHPDNRRLVVERLNREQTVLDLLLCDVADGACTPIHTEEHTTWVNLGNEFTWLAGGGFLWSTERDGWKALEHRADDGSLVRRLTPEGWAITSLDTVIDKTVIDKTVIDNTVIEASGDEPGSFVVTAHSTGTLGAAERHVFAGSLDGSEFRRLTETSGWHTAVASPSGYWVETWSDADTPPRKQIRDLAGETTFPLPYVAPPYDPESLPRWRLFTIPGPDGSRLPAQLLEPAGFHPADAETGRRYPVIMYHYGGPGSQVVANRWPGGRLRALWHKVLASQGYAIFSVDNQASTFFGKAGEDLLHRRFGEVELAGQLAGVDYLKSQPWVDPDRIGLWGWSGGGSHTLYSLFRSPGTWAAGISGAPVTDWRYYDAIWMERYLDHPRDNIDGYQQSAPIVHAGGLEDPLLLIHGTADNNVHPQNSINLVRRLIDHGKQIDLQLYPGQRHSLQTFDRASQRHLFDRMTQFFDRWLQDGGGD